MLLCGHVSQAVGLSTVSLEQEGPQAAGLRDYSMHVDQTLKGVTEGTNTLSGQHACLLLAMLHSPTRTNLTPCYSVMVSAHRWAFNVGAREAARHGGEGSAERAPWNAAPAASTVAPNGAQQGTSGSGKAGASGGEDQTSGPALARTSTTGYEPTPGAQAPQSAAQMQQLMSLITANNLNPNMIPSLQAMVAASSASAAAAGNSASGAAASGQSLTTAQLHQALAQALIAQGGGSGARGGGGAAGMSGVVKNEQGTEEGDDDALGAASDGDEDDDSDGDENGGRGNHKNRADGGAGKRLRFEDLQAQFGLGLKEAAANLGICATTLKRACRRHGIKRWPRRQIVKLSKALTQMGYSGPPPPGLIQTAATAALSQVPEPAPAPQPLTTAQLQQQQQQQLVALLSTGNAPAGASKAAGAGNGAPKAPQQPQAPGSATAGSAAAAIAMHPLLASLGGQMPGAAPQPPQAPQAAPSALASQAAAAMLMQQQQAMQSAQGGTANTMLMMQQMLSRGGNGASAMPAAQPNDVNMMLAMQHAALMQQQQRQQQQHPQSQPHHMQHQLQQQAQQQPPPQQQRQMHPMSMQPQQPALDAAGGGGGGQPLVSSSSSLQGAALPPMHFMYGDGPLGTAANTAMVPALVHELDGEGGAGAMQTSRSGLGGNGLSKPGMGELGMGSSTLSIPTGTMHHRAICYRACD